jgi:hypothetical protein
MIVFELHFAAAVRYFPIEFNNQMFAFDRELRSGTVAKVESTIETCSADNIGGVRRIDLEDLAIRARRGAASILVVEERQGVGSGRPADFGPIGNARPPTPLVGVKHFDRTRAPGVFAESEYGKCEDEEGDPFHRGIPEPMLSRSRRYATV